MAVDFHQLRNLVIRPVCELFNRAPEATTLLMRIAAHESLGGTYLHQVEGPALGIYQMEPATIQLVDRWVRDNWMKIPATAHHLIDVVYANSLDEEIIFDLRFATLYARLLLYASKWMMPDEDDHETAYAIWRDVWRPGKPCAPETFLAEYQAWKEGRPL